MKKIVEMENIQSQIDALTVQINAMPRFAPNYYERGKLYWRLGNRAAAITDFNTAVSLDPSSPAASYLKMANEILDFYNHDLYNP